MTNCIFFGIATSVVSFIYTLVLYFLGFHGEKMEQGQILGWGGLVIFIVGLVLSIRAARAEKLEDGKAFTYGNGFGTGFLTAVFVGIMGSILGYLYGSYINPEMSDYAWAMQEQQMIEKGMSDEQIEQVEGMTRKMMSPGAQAIFAVVGSLFMGAIFSLIIAIFTRGKPEETADVVPGD